MSPLRDGAPFLIHMHFPFQLRMRVRLLWNFRTAVSSQNPSQTISCYFTMPFVTRRHKTSSSQSDYPYSTLLAVMFPFSNTEPSAFGGLIQAKLGRSHSKRSVHLASSLETCLIAPLSTVLAGRFTQSRQRIGSLQRSNTTYAAVERTKWRARLESTLLSCGFRRHAGSWTLIPTAAGSASNPL